MSFILTKEELGRNKSIPLEEIEKDILETELEIEKNKLTIEKYKQLGDKLSLYFASAYEHRIFEKEAFIEKLKILVSFRKNQQ